jgi:transcriptional regulator with XRE-family HTH domain
VAEGGGGSPLLSLARQVRGWADTVLGMAGTATDLGLSLAQSAVKDPGRKATVAEAGRLLRQWREAAGLTLDEVSEAIGLGDSKLMTQAEGGIVSLPFDVVLRLAGVLGRHDPIPLVMGLTRQYNPDLWTSLEELGIGKLAVQGTRERQLANIYRRSDAARALDDERFDTVLAFTQQAFDTALALTAPLEGAPATPPAAAGSAAAADAAPARRAKGVSRTAGRSADQPAAEPAAKAPRAARQAAAPRRSTRA